MFTDPTLHAASIFAGMALVLTLIAFAFGSSRRRGLVPMLVVLLVGLLILLARDTLQTWFGSPTAHVVARELGLGLVAFGFFRIAIIFSFQTVLARRNIPKILDDVVIALALVAYAVYRLQAGGVNLAGIITTSALLGALAFSAQQTLGNLWGGITLQVEKTCRIGDWVRVDNLLGQVVTIRWRYMAIATNANETIVIPNSHVMNNRVTVVARRGEEYSAWVRYLPFQLAFAHTPSKVIERLERALAEAEIRNVVRDPPPQVGFTNFRENGLEYTVRYALVDPSDYWRTDSDIRVHVFAAIARESLTIPLPQRVVEMRGDARPEKAQAEHAARLRALRGSELFGPLTEAELDAVALELNALLFADGDVIFHAGEKADSLYLVAEGAVRVLNEKKERRYELARLVAPSYFGEMGLLLGQPRAATVVADGEALCYRLDKRGFDTIIQARPELADALARMLAQRQAENDATLRALDADARARHTVSRTSEFVRRIQQFFGLDSREQREKEPAQRGR
jgi:small-conductance mechanosensitive channel/CRP-like cAMP-binding protein